MTDAELEDLYIWYGYDDEPQFGDCFKSSNQHLSYVLDTI